MKHENYTIQRDKNYKRWFFSPWDNDFVGPFNTKEECQKEIRYHKHDIPHLGCNSYPNCSIYGCN